MRKFALSIRLLVISNFKSHSSLSISLYSLFLHNPHNPSSSLFSTPSTPTIGTPSSDPAIRIPSSVSAFVAYTVRSILNSHGGTFSLFQNPFLLHLLPSVFLLSCFLSSFCGCYNESQCKPIILVAEKPSEARLNLSPKEIQTKISLCDVLIVHSKIEVTL